MGFKAFTDGSAGLLHSDILRQIEKIKNEGENIAPQIYTDIFYEIINFYSSKLIISDRPIYDICIAGLSEAQRLSA